MNIIKKTIDLGNGKHIEIETGKVAKQADGSVMLKVGNTMLLATVCADVDAKEGVDFMPLTVEYVEKFASAGKIPGGFFKREARPTENEILTSRLVDRALRPLFPDDYHANVVVHITLFSADLNELPDAYACLAATAALSVSTIPFNGPISEVRVIRHDGKWMVNPNKDTIESAATDINIIVAATAKSIVMVEGEMKEVSEAEMVEAISLAHEAIKNQLVVIKELESAAGTTEKRTFSHEKHDDELKAKIYDACYAKCEEVAAKGLDDKYERSDLFKSIKKEFVATLSDEEAKEKSFLIGQYFHKCEKEAVRNVMLSKQIRLDGRKMDQIRPIWSEVGYLPSPHGSALFTRGETQSLTTVTLGTSLDAQMIDGVVISGDKKFMLHYNFPPYSTGEARTPRGTSRRETGHGNLAFRAIERVLPSDIPYTVRIVSEILESNGSSSMATVCAGTLALMDAGVKITAPVSGIAMGLVTDDKGRYVVLSDILGDEDHLGDMDFKVTGTENGITACQMDIKVQGLSYEVLAEALSQAKEGRLHILNEMKKAMPAVREDFKPQTPRATVIKIMKDQIGAVIGPGGKVVQDIQKQSGATVTIEEKEDGGYVSIFSSNGDAMAKAVSMVRSIVTVPEVGEVYEGKVKNIQAFGAFVEFLPGKDGLLHISEISWDRIDTMDGVFKEGDKVKVKLVEVDKKTGKFRLSAKVLLPKPEKPEAPAASAE